MTDSQRFMEYCRESGLKIGAIAKAANLSRQGLWNKIHNKSEFRAGEIAAICEFMSMPKSIRDSIFFAKQVD